MNVEDIQKKELISRCFPFTTAKDGAPMQRKAGKKFLEWLGASAIITLIVFVVSLCGWLPSQQLMYYASRAELQRRIWTIQQSYIDPQERKDFYLNQWGKDGWILNMDPRRSI